MRFDTLMTLSEFDVRFGDRMTRRTFIARRRGPHGGGNGVSPENSPGHPANAPGSTGGNGVSPENSPGHPANAPGSTGGTSTTEEESESTTSGAEKTGGGTTTTGGDDNKGSGPTHVVATDGTTYQVAGDGTVTKEENGHTYTISDEALLDSVRSAAGSGDVTGISGKTSQWATPGVFDEAPSQGTFVVAPNGMTYQVSADGTVSKEENGHTYTIRDEGLRSSVLRAAGSGDVENLSGATSEWAAPGVYQERPSQGKFVVAPNGTTYEVGADGTVSKEEDGHTYTVREDGLRSDVLWAAANEDVSQLSGLSSPSVNSGVFDELEPAAGQVQAGGDPSPRPIGAFNIGAELRADEAWFKQQFANLPDDPAARAQKLDELAVLSKQTSQKWSSTSITDWTFADGAGNAVRPDDYFRGLADRIAASATENRQIDAANQARSQAADAFLAEDASAVAALTYTAQPSDPVEIETRGPASEFLEQEGNLAAVVQQYERLVSEWRDKPESKLVQIPVDGPGPPGRTMTPTEYFQQRLDQTSRQLRQASGERGDFETARAFFEASTDQFGKDNVAAVGALTYEPQASDPEEIETRGQFSQHIEAEGNLEATAAHYDRLAQQYLNSPANDVLQIPDGQGGTITPAEYFGRQRDLVNQQRDTIAGEHRMLIEASALPDESAVGYVPPRPAAEVFANVRMSEVPLGPMPTTESYAGNFSPWLDAEGNQVNTEAEAAYVIEGTGSDAVIKDVNSIDVPWSRTKVMRGRRGNTLKYGELHGQKPWEAKGRSDQNVTLQKWVAKNLEGRRIDRWGNVQYAANPQFDQSATPLGNITGAGESGDLTRQPGSETFALHASHAKIQGVNPDGTLDLSGGSAGRWAERVGGFIPGFNTLYGVGLAYDPASPDGAKWSAGEKRGIAKDATLDSLYVFGFPYGGINIVRNVAQGSGRALLQHPVRHIVKPLVWDAALPNTVQRVSGQLGSLSRATYQTGRSVASGRGFRSGPGAFRNKAAGVGKGLRGETGEELVESPIEFGVERLFEGKGEFNNPILVGANIAGFGLLDGLSRGVRPRWGTSDPAVTAAGVRLQNQRVVTRQQLQQYLTAAPPADRDLQMHVTRGNALSRQSVKLDGQIRDFRAENPGFDPETIAQGNRLLDQRAANMLALHPHIFGNPPPGVDRDTYLTRGRVLGRRVNNLNQDIVDFRRANPELGKGYTAGGATVPAPQHVRELSGDIDTTNLGLKPTMPLFPGDASFMVASPRPDGTAARRIETLPLITPSPDVTPTPDPQTGRIIVTTHEPTASPTQTRPRIHPPTGGEAPPGVSPGFGRPAWMSPSHITSSPRFTPDPTPSPTPSPSLAPGPSPDRRVSTKPDTAPGVPSTTRFDPTITPHVTTITTPTPTLVTSTPTPTPVATPSPTPQTTPSPATSPTVDITATPTPSPSPTTASPTGRWPKGEGDKHQGNQLNSPLKRWPRTAQWHTQVEHTIDLATGEQWSRPITSKHLESLRVVAKTDKPVRNADYIGGNLRVRTGPKGKLLKPTAVPVRKRKASTTRQAARSKELNPFLTRKELRRLKRGSF